MTIPLSWGESTLDIDVRRGESTHPSPMHLPNLTWFRAPTNLWQGFRGATFQHFEHLRSPTISAAHECHSRDRSGEATPAEIVDRPGKNCDVVQTHLSSIRDMDTKKLDAPFAAFNTWASTFQSILYSCNTRSNIHLK